MQAITADTVNAYITHDNWPSCHVNVSREPSDMAALVLIENLYSLKAHGRYGQKTDKRHKEQ